MGKIFNIVRMKKVKTCAHLRNVENHNKRQEKKLSNVDYSKTQQNVELIKKEQNFNDYFESLRDKHKFKVIETGKNQTVKAVEFVFSASPDFFKDKTRNEIIEYFKDNIRILKSNYYKEKGSIISAVIHFDETTPHCHVVVVPLVKRKKLIKRGKFKGQEIEKIVLSQKEILGGVRALNNLQDVFNKELNNKAWKVDRGVKTERATHTELKEFYKDIKNLPKNTKRAEKLRNEIKELKNDKLKIFKIDRILDISEQSLAMSRTLILLKREKEQLKELNEAQQRITKKRIGNRDEKIKGLKLTILELKNENSQLKNDNNFFNSIFEQLKKFNLLEKVMQKLQQLQKQQKKQLQEQETNFLIELNEKMKQSNKYNKQELELNKNVQKMIIDHQKRP